jgi:hypothetical protein
MLAGYNMRSQAVIRCIDHGVGGGGKILGGAELLSKVEAGEFEEATLKAWMSVALTRPDDRELFGLPVARSDP